MRKPLNTDSITNELAGASAFFPKPPLLSDAISPSSGASEPVASIEQVEQPLSAPVPVADNQPDTMTLPTIPDQQPSKQPAMKASMLASYPDSLVETIRKAVK